MPDYGGARFTDGESVVVETRKGSFYRLSRYDNPYDQENSEALPIVRILRTLRSEFMSLNKSGLGPVKTGN